MSDEEMAKIESKGTAQLDYAKQNSTLAFRVDMFLGVAAVCIVFPLAGLLIFLALRMRDPALTPRLVFIASAMAACGFGVWCVKTAFRTWRLRNLIEPPAPIRVQSLRWRWILPAAWIGIALWNMLRRSATVTERYVWMGGAILCFLAFAKALYLHIKIFRAERRSHFHKTTLSGTTPSGQVHSTDKVNRRQQ
jgi:hypothetical protein